MVQEWLFYGTSMIYYEVREERRKRNKAQQLARFEPTPSRVFDPEADAPSLGYNVCPRETDISARFTYLPSIVSFVPDNAVSQEVQLKLFFSFFSNFQKFQSLIFYLYHIFRSAQETILAISEGGCLSLSHLLLACSRLALHVMEVVQRLDRLRILQVPSTATNR